MNWKIIIFGLEIALVVLVLLTAPASADPNVIYFDPDVIDIAPGEEITVTMWLNSTEGITGYGTSIHFDPDVVNITAITSAGDFPESSRFRHHENFVSVNGVTSDWEDLPPGTWKMADLTFVANNSGNSGTCAIYHFFNSLFDWTGYRPVSEYTWIDGTFTCTPLPETFEKELVLGWNLISLPLITEDNSTDVVLSSISGNYDAVYRYDAISNEFKEVSTGTINPGTGYFVNVTVAGTWSYEGSRYDVMNIDLKKGLNLIGWLNCSKDISDGLFSISDQYNYVARWNTNSSSYEIYDTNAPPGVPEFIDFDMISRGEGCWIVAKEDCTLIEKKCF